MGLIIGIRREDKNEWERRVPLTPADVANLKRDHGLDFIVQPSGIRVFADDEFSDAGAVVDEDLGPAGVVLAVKEIPIPLLRPETTYLYFSHTVKGQDYNMPMLRHLLDVGATLIDYEKIADEQSRRLIFFSIHAGFAGMIETLWCLGRRFAALGRRTPLLEVKHAYEYRDLEEAKAHMRELGTRIAAEGLGEHHAPVIIGVAGYGNVARGCQEILDCLGVRAIPVAELPAAAASTADELGPLVSVTFKEEDMVRPRSSDAQFVLKDYYERPENYVGVFAHHLPHLDVLMNAIYWQEQYPRLVTRKWAKANYGPGRSPRLQVIGDISCDIEGGVELTLEASHPDDPCFVYDPETQRIAYGVEGDGPAIMAVDNLPCELPRESSEHFSSVLRKMVPALAATDFDVGYEVLNLPLHLKRAVIAHRGKLAPGYRYLQEYLDQ